VCPRNKKNTKRDEVAFICAAFHVLAYLKIVLADGYLIYKPFAHFQKTDYTFFLISRSKLLVIPPSLNDFFNVGGHSVEHGNMCVCVCLCFNVLVTFPFKNSLTASAFIISPLINTKKLLTQRKREAEIKNKRRERDAY